MKEELEILEKATQIAKNIPWLRNKFHELTFSTFWKKSVLPLAEEIDQEYHFDKEYGFNFSIALKQSPLQSLVNSIFEENHRIISNKDIAVALYVSVKGYSLSCIQRETLIDAANTFTKELYRIISNSFLYKTALKLKKRKTFISKRMIHKHIIKNILSDNHLLFSSYFERFEDQDMFRKMRIHFPQTGKSYLDYDLANSIEINFGKIDHGFSLIGLDYKILHEGNEEPLQMAHKVENCEKLNFSKGNNKELIWLR